MNVKSNPLNNLFEALFELGLVVAVGVVLTLTLARELITTLPAWVVSILVAVFALPLTYSLYRIAVAIRAIKLPVLRLSVTPDQAHLGERLKIGWALEGQTKAIRQFVVQLVG